MDFEYGFTDEQRNIDPQKLLFQILANISGNITILNFYHKIGGRINFSYFFFNFCLKQSYLYSSNTQFAILVSAKINNWPP